MCSRCSCTFRQQRKRGHFRPYLSPHHQLHRQCFRQMSLQVTGREKHRYLLDQNRGYQSRRQALASRDSVTRFSTHSLRCQDPSLFLHNHNHFHWVRDQLMGIHDRTPFPEGQVGGKPPFVEVFCCKAPGFYSLSCYYSCWFSV